MILIQLMDVLARLSDEVEAEIDHPSHETLAELVENAIELVNVLGRNCATQPGATP